MQGKIRASGLNPISQIPQSKLVPTNVPASVMAHLCGANPAMTEVLLDVRQEVFTKMMDLPA
jgi:hypothetical protein